MLPVRLKSVATIGPPTSGYPFSLCFASLSQKWNVPSLPEVENVPWTGWKEMALTEYTWLMSRLEVGFWRWHLNEKLFLYPLAMNYFSTGIQLTAVPFLRRN